MSPNKYLVSIFTDHVEYLFGEEEIGVKWITNWAAQMLQNPSKRGTVSPFHISPRTGTGRGAFADILRELVGALNSSDTSISRMATDGSFRGYLKDKLLCTIGETLEQSGSKYGISQQIKKQLSDPHLTLNVKYGSDELSYIMTRFLFMSNFVIGMNIDDNERRLAVFANNKPPRSAAYYDRLYGAMEKPEFYHNVWSYLMNYKVSMSMLMTTPKTNAREQMIRATYSALGKIYADFKSIVKFYEPSMFEAFADRHNAIHSPNDFAPINTKELNMLEREHVVHTKTCFSNIGGTRITVSVRGFTRVEFTVFDEERTKAEDAINKYFAKWE
jgi:hypothetical protein